MGNDIKSLITDYDRNIIKDQDIKVKIDLA